MHPKEGIGIKKDKAIVISNNNFEINPYTKNSIYFVAVMLQFGNSVVVMWLIRRQGPNYKLALLRSKFYLRISYLAPSKGNSAPPLPPKKNFFFRLAPPTSTSRRCPWIILKHFLHQPLTQLCVISSIRTTCFFISITFKSMASLFFGENLSMS